jgi:hypothetical protein
MPTCGRFAAHKLSAAGQAVDSEVPPLGRIERPLGATCVAQRRRDGFRAPQMAPGGRGSGDCEIPEGTRGQDHCPEREACRATLDVHTILLSHAARRAS